MNTETNQFIASDHLLTSFSCIFTNNLLPYYEKKVRKGDIIFCTDSPHKYSYYVKSGIIKNYIITPDGKEKVLFFYKTGCLFGFQNINLEKRTITEAVAIKDCELYQFEYDIFHEFIRNSPEYYSSFLSYIFNMMILKTEEVINLTFYTTIERLSKLLFILEKEYCQNQSSCHDILIPHNNEELGSMIGASRNSISSSIAILQDERIIEKRRNGIIIKDRQRLKEFASESSENIGANTSRLI